MAGMREELDRHLTPATPEPDDVEALAGLEQWHTGPPNDIYVVQGRQLHHWLAAHDAAVRARAAAEALRETADRWTQSAWSDVMLPKPTPPAVPVIAYANRVGDWLRARAAEQAQR